MSQLIPETLTRLQATMFVAGAELENASRSERLRHAAEALAESGLRKLMRDCIKSEGSYMGYQGQTLRLDVYVLSPDELHKLIAEARMQGERDALKYRST